MSQLLFCYCSYSCCGHFLRHRFPNQQPLDEALHVKQPFNST